MIYFLRRADGAIKVGYTGTNFDQRLYEHELRYGTLEILGMMDGDIRAEKAIHRRFRPYRAEARTGEREWYHPTEELIAFIEANAKLPIPVVKRRTHRLKTYSVYGIGWKFVEPTKLDK